MAVTDQVIRIYLDELNAAAAAEGLNPDTPRPWLPPTTRFSARSSSAPSPLACASSTPPNPPPPPPCTSSATTLLGAPSFPRLLRKEWDRMTPSPQRQPQIACFATDSVEKIERLGSRFLGRPVGNVHLVDLGRLKRFHSCCVPEPLSHSGFFARKKPPSSTAGNRCGVL